MPSVSNPMNSAKNIGVAMDFVNQWLLGRLMVATNGYFIDM
jgi:hypothetical protein